MKTPILWIISKCCRGVIDAVAYRERKRNKEHIQRRLQELSTEETRKP